MLVQEVRGVALLELLEGAQALLLAAAAEHRARVVLQALLQEEQVQMGVLFQEEMVEEIPLVLGVVRPEQGESTAAGQAAQSILIAVEAAAAAAARDTMAAAAAARPVPTQVAAAAAAGLATTLLVRVQPGVVSSHLEGRLTVTMTVLPARAVMAESQLQRRAQQGVVDLW